MRRGRPFVTMKVALSRDGFVAGPAGRAVRADRRCGQPLHSARAGGSRRDRGRRPAPSLADDPLLTARGAFRTLPLTRVVFDRRLRTPPGARLLSTARRRAGNSRSAMAADDPAARDRADRLSRAGAHIEWIPQQPSDGFLRASFSRLAGRRRLVGDARRRPAIARARSGTPASWTASRCSRRQRRSGPAGWPGWIRRRSRRRISTTSLRCGWETM